MAAAGLRLFRMARKASAKWLGALPEIIRDVHDYVVILDDGKNPKQSIGRARYVHKAKVSTGRARSVLDGHDKQRNKV